MSMLEEIIAMYPGWDTDGNGDSSCLITPCGCEIEQDGTCQHGTESLLLTLGMI